MSRQPPGSHRHQRPDGQVHHISSIAHLFLAEDELAAESRRCGASQSFAVTCFHDSRVSAFVCGALATAARQVAGRGGGRPVRLREDAGLAWSVRSFLADDKLAASRMARGQPGHWTWSPEGSGAGAAGLVQWSHLADNRDFEADEIEPDGAIICLLACEVGQLPAGVRLGRLLGQLRPRRLEILVFPDEWATERLPASEGRGWRGFGGGGQAALLARCRDLTRAIGGCCPVTITTLPANGAGEAGAGTTSILHKLAQRLLGDFSVDPGS